MTYLHFSAALRPAAGLLLDKVALHVEPLQAELEQPLDEGAAQVHVAGTQRVHGGQQVATVHRDPCNVPCRWDNHKEERLDASSVQQSPISLEVLQDMCTVGNYNDVIVDNFF